ncbi:xylan O-acetyltransferase 1 isoform X2 [Elaeis guineensis]|uniref:Protein ESKIMO 1 isoform X2 n=1 Tax=Elaeis guineensis var. tenera TaxID=51953 RepID=A0A6I9R5J2_ELAGV|nr:protein ESKIMO 1 isoform X2 [Elaeis guineensis]
MLFSRRKSSSLFTPEPFMMKQAAFNGRKNGNLSIFVVVFSVFLFALFMYNEDVKSIAEFPFSSRSRAKSQEVSHQHQDPSSGQQEGKPKGTESSTTEVETRQDGGEERRRTKVVFADEDGPAGVRLPVIKEVEEAAHEERAAGPKEKIKEEEKLGEKEVEEDRTVVVERTVVSVPEGCDLFTGQWVYDNVTRPIYKEHECEFLTEQVTCMRNGRKDDSFQKWRWQPRDCNLPRFDARIFMERLRGKRLMFVGDSLNRNQWESMVCLVQSAAPPGKKTLVKNGSLNVFRLQEYNATVEFYWAPFLVESNSDDPNLHSIQNRIIMPESIKKHGKNWKGVDYLIFNTYIWWMNTFNMKVLRGSFDEGATEYDEMDRPKTYRRVLKTWAKWVEKNVDPKRTMVFFMSMSPNHIKSEEWDNPNGIKCAQETEPVMSLPHALDVGTDWRLFDVAVNVTRSMRKVPVWFLSITALSELRKDAHTSVHTLRQGKLLTREQQADPANYADCIHWCLPGLPDVWNEFLYARIASSPWSI